jgi:hypothetical protein
MRPSPSPRYPPFCNTVVVWIMIAQFWWCGFGRIACYVRAAGAHNFKQISMFMFVQRGRQRGLSHAASTNTIIQTTIRILRLLKSEILSALHETSPGARRTTRSGFHAVCAGLVDGERSTHGQHRHLWILPLFHKNLTSFNAMSATSKLRRIVD